MTAEEVSQVKMWTERGSCHLVAARGTMGGRDRKWKVPLEGPAQCDGEGPALIQTRMGLDESEVLPETVLLVEARKGLLRHQLSLFFTVLHSVGAYITKLGVSHLILHL